MPLSVFQVLFKANLISRAFQDSPVYSSTFQACANPVVRAFALNRSNMICFLPLTLGIIINTAIWGKNKLLRAKQKSHIHTATVVITMFLRSVITVSNAAIFLVI